MACEQTPIRAIKSNENFYKYNFNEVSCLGSGGFSTVFKCEYKLNKTLYAIKKVGYKLEDETIIYKELQILAGLKNCDYVVNYIDSWSEVNYYVGNHSKGEETNISSCNLLYSPNLPFVLHIQMELCSLTLRDVINIIEKECLTHKNTLSVVGYYISSELLYEILECVQFLHSQNPAIIHRDLKPENILLTKFVNNRFVKLSDFGLSTFHESDEQSHTKHTGTKNYRAIEVDSTRRYTTTADLYSLGVILKELFYIDISDPYKAYLPLLEDKMSYLINIDEKLLSWPLKRPNCDELLADKDRWRLSQYEIMSDNQFIVMLSTFTDLSQYPTRDCFKEIFVKNKFEDNSTRKDSKKQISVDFNFIENISLIESDYENKVIKYDSGYQHSVALTKKGYVYTWSSDFLKQNKPNLLTFSVNKYIIDVCCGSLHTFLLTKFGDVYAFGNNINGVLGCGFTSNFEFDPIKVLFQEDQKITSISCGQSHALARSQSGNTYSWGLNDFGQLGINSLTSQNKPVLIDICENNTVISIRKIACGSNHSLLLSDNGDIYSFGGDIFYRPANKIVVCGKLLMIFKQKFPLKVKSYLKFVDISAHFNKSIALSETGKFYIWGINQKTPHR